jgi:hypothetical protein
MAPSLAPPTIGRRSCRRDQNRSVRRDHNQAGLRRRSRLHVVSRCPAALSPGCAVVYAGEHSHDYLVMVASLAVVGMVLAYFCIRLTRVAVRFDGAGVTVRNFWRTHRLAWNEVSQFTDGSFWGDWALRVVLRDGRTVTAAGTGMQYSMRGKLRKKEVLSAVGDVADRHSVGADLTGWPPGAKAGATFNHGRP